MSVFTTEHFVAAHHLFYGRQHVANRSDYAYLWKAVKAVAAGDGVLSQPEQLHLLGRMCSLLTPSDVIEEVMRFDEHADSPERLAARIEVPDELRAGTGAWIVYQALSVAIADGDLAAREIDGVRRVAANMSVPGNIVDMLTQLCREEDSMRLRRIDLLNSTIPAAFRFARPQPQPSMEPLPAQ